MTFGVREDAVRLKIKWAYKHFLDFYEVLRRFIESDPCGITPERDPQTQEVVYRVTHNVVVPSDLRLMAGDVLQNLRSALDYLACALVAANGGKVSSQIGFPVLEKAPPTPNDEASFARKIKGMRQEAVDLVLCCQPYVSGDKDLWRLHELNRREKHRLLLTVGGFINNWSIAQHIDATNPPLEVMERMGRAFASEDTWTHVRLSSFPLKAGDEVFRDFPNAKVNEKIKFGIQVAVNEAGVCDAEPLLGVLHNSITCVWRIVWKFSGMY
jgi:hypothetical protein